MARVRLSPKEEIRKLVKAKPGITRSEVAAKLGISYWSSRYWLERLTKEGFVEKSVTWIIRPYMRRVTYYPVIPKVYYRTQYAMMFYTEKPRTKTPDPIESWCVQ